MITAATKGGTMHDNEEHFLKDVLLVLNKHYGRVICASHTKIQENGRI